MKKFERTASIFLSLALIATTIPPVNVLAAGADAQAELPELVTMYDKPASDWQSEGTPMGNGFIGAMIFGGVAKDRIQINEHTLWSGGPGSDENYDGGMSNATAEQNKQNLQSAREELQQIMSDFTKDYTVNDDGSGTKNYPNLPAALNNKINSLKGEKDHFGSYQSLGEIIIQSADEPISLGYTVTGCLNTGIAPLFDGNVDTKWFSSDGGGWDDDSTTYPVAITASYDKPVTISGYSLTSANDDYDRDPKAWKFYGSNGDDIWTELDSQPGYDFTARHQEASFTLAGRVAYSQYKWEILENDGGWGTQLAEIALHREKNSIYPIITTNAEAGNPGESVAKIFDNNNSTKWYTLAGGSGPEAYPAWAAIEYQSALTIASYAVVSGNDMPRRDPATWELQGSDDGEVWTTLDTQNVTFDGRKQQKNFTLNEAASYSHYRFYVTSVLDAGNGMQLSDLIFYDADHRVVGTTEEHDTAAADYRRVLNLNDSITTVSYAQEDVHYEREYFVSNPDNFMAIRLTADKAGALEKFIQLDTPQQAAAVTSEGDTITMTGKPADQLDSLEHLEFAAQIKVRTDGTCTAVSGGILVQGASEITLYMTAGTNYQQCMDDTFDYFTDEDPLDAVKARIAAVSAKEYEALKQAHMDDYHSLFNRVELNLCDVEASGKTTDQLLSGYKNGSITAAEKRYLEMVYYQFGRYLLIASSREGSLPANLQGIWADGLTPPWSADYHTNINIQMNYWLAEQTNLTECHQPIVDYINGLVPRGEDVAQRYHCTEDGGDVRGWTTYHENNIWGNTGPAVSDAFYFPAGAAWMCQDIWEIYAYNLDKEFLAANFDTMKDAALFWVDNLVTDARDGTLVSSPSWSPEHGPYSLGAACDQGIIWDLFNNTIEAAEALNIKTSEIDEIRAAMDKLSGPKIGKNGQFQEWKDEIYMDVTGDNGHRHVNQLFALHPGRQIVAGRSEQDDAFVDAMKVTLNTRGDGGTGWSKAWKINFWARLRDGNHAGTMVEQIIKESTYNNLFDAHPPFQIDGNFGATAGMTEMLLQSQGDSIDLLAALPDMWSSGSVSGLRARGNVEVDMSWSEKQLTQATLQTFSASDALRLRGQGLGSFRLTDAAGHSVPCTVIDANTIEFASKAGETYTVLPGGTQSKYSIELSADRTNVQPDGDVTITVTARGGAYVGAACKLSYDGDKFTLKDAPDGWESVGANAYGYYNVINGGFYEVDTVLGAFVFTAKGQDADAAGTFRLSDAYMAGQWEEGWSKDDAVKLADSSIDVLIASAPAYEVETVTDYVAGHSLVLVYTNSETAMFSYDGKPMYDVTSAGYQYDGAGYKRVYGLVTKDASKDKVAADAAEIAGTLTYSPDVNGSNGVDLYDAVAVVAVYNANALYMDAIHMDIVLKADVNKDKTVNVDDFGLIKAEYT